MNLTIEKIKSLKPCQDRLDNFVQNYPKFDGSFADFLNLEHASYNDKVWVGVRLLNRNQLVEWSIMCAESVLHIFENKNPSDTRVRDCLEGVKLIKDFNNLTDVERAYISLLGQGARAAYVATNAAANVAAANVAYAAYAAAYAAAAYAAAANVAAANVAYAANVAAAYAAAYDADAREEQTNLNLLLLASLIQ